ncbi:hypothetical protein L2E82_01975 [Cichorium intybus]|uniref:Uncharacterized protein n=1 Tax=Cichorium intybus TaxID=13427 RepID=A0ACB9H1Y5_CICIN|nr:hypothetical protein L2E82_01975 [Cichorium intybus]
MESVTTLLGDWNTFNGVHVTEEAYFMAQFLDNFPQISSPFELSSTCWPQHELTTSFEVDETSVYLSNNTNSNLHCLSDDNELSPSSRKRSSSMADVYENREKIKCKKIHEGDANFGKIMKIYGSDEDSNWSQESISPRPKEAQILKSNVKTKASRGSATDPQSVYARKRRERINERLRLLQSLVPNGTKVDISTMLEEAVQYVKFLQLQIKLLSSDDLWMYAPIAHNGLDIGLDLPTISSLSPR